ncbi:MAG: flagellar motor protein MotB [Lachnospiraceae bacterium]|nr:flagellar motor protein MotB [Lachnospiraceae bacterium]MBQ8912975.1 flagellar motor protein MotB [Lachnospiraceae bacterium]MBQ9233818.1 flagellar motor protein MotB [Lachnospiraceae bacterium]
MAKKKEQPAEEGSPAWMATFSDLMNLLLCFFVLLFASSTMDEGKIQKIMASFNNMNFSILNEGNISLLSGDMMSGGVTQVPDIQSILTQAGRAIDGNPGEDQSASSSDAEKLSDEELKNEYDKRGEEQSEEMYEEIVQMAESYSIDDEILLDYNAQYVELNLNGSILFDSGKAEVREDSKMFLQKIASILVKYKYCIIEIEGHTDNVPISTSRFENNRALSTERARNVYEYLMTQENFIDANMKIAGYGESKPIASNATEEGRAKNRRVVIKIYNQQNSVN